MTEAGGAFDLEAAAASVMSQGHDIGILLNVLASQLESTIPDRAQVERRSGLFHHSDEVVAIQVSIGNEQLRADKRGGELICHVFHSSGGIRIRSEQLDMAQWIQRLLSALQAEAVHSSAARSALESIVIGEPT